MTCTRYINSLHAIFLFVLFVTNQYLHVIGKVPTTTYYGHYVQLYKSGVCTLLYMRLRIVYYCTT
jgi:hypothetical protein